MHAFVPPALLPPPGGEVVWASVSLPSWFIGKERMIDQVVIGGWVDYGDTKEV